jgi:hypothetical protein
MWLVILQLKDDAWARYEKKKTKGGLEQLGEAFAFVWVL